MSGALLAALTVGGGLVVWAEKMAEMSAQAAAELDGLRSESDAARRSAQADADQAAVEAKRRLDESGARYEDLDSRYTALSESAERRQRDAEQRIAALEADLTATREVAAKLARRWIGSKILRWRERRAGRVRALDQAMVAQTARASDLDRRLAEAQEFGTRTKKDLDERDAELKRVVSEHEAFLAEGGLQNELNKAVESRVQSEAKLAQLQKTLAATENRLAMVQKEFMTAVGVPSAPIKTVEVVRAPAPAPQGAGGDRRVKELEEKIAQLEADARKKAREDGYKIAELEYKLAEMVDKK
ncbi:MAG: hypothetical protein IPK32_15590 [Verrucomicrobiaceae bacterium]|nr:hypothetical protein [Verrucomicrobiaceae bacterium]